MRIKRSAVVLMFLAGIGAGLSHQMGAAGPLDGLSYEIRTVYQPSEGDALERTSTGVLIVPTLVDVDADLSTGVAGADVTVQLTIDAGRATLRVSKLPGAPLDMPLLVEAILRDPRGGDSPLRVAFGYDALADRAPEVYSATVHLVGARRVTSFSLDVETVGTGSTIGVIAEVFTAGENGARVDPQRGRLDLTPVPNAVHFGLLQGSDFGTQQSGVDITTSLPTRADVVIEDIQANRTVRGDITIDVVPHIVSLVLTESEDGRNTWNYQASDVIDLIDLQIRETRGNQVVDDFVLHLEQMALTAILVQDTATHATFQADRPIGVIEAGIGRGGPVAWLDDPAYLHFTDDDGDSFAFRILGLQRAELGTGDPFLVDVTMQPGPFHVLIEEGSLTVDGWIRDLPSRIRLQFSPSQGTADWETSEGIARITVDASDPSGLAGRATDLHIELRDVPRGLSIAWGEAAGEAKLATTDGSVGRVDLLLTSGPDLEVDAGFDGVVLEDVPSHYALAVRLNGLRLVSVSTGDAPYTVDLRKAAGPFLVDLTRGTQLARVEVLDLPDSLQATFDPAGKLAYSASAPIGRITADVNDPDGITGRVKKVELRLDDVPRALTLGYETDGRALMDAHGAAIGKVTLLMTSGPDLDVDAGFDGVVLEDVPSHFAAAVRLTGLERIEVSTGAAPYTLSLRKTAGPFLIRLDQGTRTTRIEVRDVPDSVDATFDPAGSLTYAGSAPVAALDAELNDPAGVAGRATRAVATVRSIPANLDLSWDAASGTIGADARGATVGLLEVLLTSGPVESLPASRDGVILRDLPDRYVAFARLTGLRKIAFSQGPPPSFELSTTGGRGFTVAIERAKPSGIATTNVTIDVLPATINVRFTSPTTFSYTASGPVASARIDAVDPDGIAGRATEMRALFTGIPAAFDVSWNSSGQIVLDAKGGTIGLLEVQFTSGPDERLAAQFDGILLKDLSDRYVIFARMTGLRRVIGAQTPTPDITIESTGNRVLRVDLNQLEGSKVVYTRATLDRLPSSVRVRLNDRQMFYTASAATNSLVFDSNSGDRWNMHADIRDPLPASLTFCAANNGFCNGFARSSGAGSFSFDASEHTTVNVFDCVRPLNANCVRGSASEFTLLDNWRVRRFDFDADTDDVAFSGYTFNNTNGHALQGYLLRIGGSVGFEANIKPGYWSNNRRVSWDAWGLFKSRSGSVNCAGSNFSVRVFGIWIGVTDYVC